MGLPQLKFSSHYSLVEKDRPLWTVYGHRKRNRYFLYAQGTTTHKIK